MTVTDAYLLFQVGEERFALPLRDVTRVVPALWPRELPGAPEIVAGAIDLRGEIIPVVSLRARFGIVPRPMRAADQLIMARSGARLVALWVDRVEKICECLASDEVEAAQVVPDLPHLRGLLRRADGLVLIADLERLLSLEESRRLEAAMEGAGSS